MENLYQYIQYKQGTIPLILSVPHGGELKCEEIPTRTNGIRGIDKNTIFLAQDLIYHIQNIYSRRMVNKETPSYIFCNITRSNIDLNRPLENAFNQNSILAKKIYFTYHNCLKNYIAHNIDIFNKSLLLDIHGFETKSRPPGYRDVDVVLGTDNLKSLFEKPIKKRDWGDNIRGEIIKKFIELGISIAPGHPRRREYVLSGGYITKIYGASQIKHSKTIQMEFSDRVRNHNRNLKNLILKSLTEILFKYFNQSKSI